MRIIYFFLFISSGTCLAQNNIQLTIYNKSNQKLDSIVVYDVFKDVTRYYNVERDKEITKIYENKLASLPKEERAVFIIFVFASGYYYTMSAGLVGFPGSALQTSYFFYIHDIYISTKEGLIPSNRDHRKNLSDYYKTYN